MADIGVVLPVFNGAEFLSEALESIASQTVAPCDVVAVDDGSSDGSQLLLRSFGVRIITTERLGQAVARDRGIAAVRGDFLAFLDQDDRWLPHKLECQTEYLAANSDVGFVGSLCSVFLHPGARRPSWWKPAWDDGVPEPSLLPSATMYRRSAFADTGGFASTAVTVSEDMAWTARAQDMGLRRAVINEVLVERRVHDRNTSGDNDLRRQEHLAIVRSSLATKRLRHA